jgi:hypothetical protein
VKLTSYLIIGAIILGIYIIFIRKPSVASNVPIPTTSPYQIPGVALPTQPLSYFQTSPTTAKIPILPQHQSIYYYDDQHPPEFLLPPGMTYQKAQVPFAPFYQGI